MNNQEAIVRIRDHMIAHKMNEPRAIYISEALKMAIKALEQPSVTPTRPTGKWISRWYGDKHFHVCSECSKEFSYDAETGIDITNYNFCPNCGARMTESEEV